MFRLILVLFLFLFSVPLLFAQKDMIVSAKIEVLMEGAYSKDAIKTKAIEAARIKALGDEFGYAIVQGIQTQTTSKNVVSSSKLNEISSTIVQGEWIADLKGFPKTRFEIRDKGEDQEIWLHCEVKGRARKIENASVAFEAFTYNCKEADKCQTDKFKNEESLFLYFKTPVKGYLSVFLQEKGLVYRLLPYAKMSGEYESYVSVFADQPYHLFSPEHRSYFKGFGIVDEYGLQTGENGEPMTNLLYVVFSKNPFDKPVLTEKDGLKFIEMEKFQAWLNKNKGLNKDFQVSRIPIFVMKEE